MLEARPSSLSRTAPRRASRHLNQRARLPNDRNKPPELGDKERMVTDDTIPRSWSMDRCAIREVLYLEKEVHTDSVR